MATQPNGGHHLDTEKQTSSNEERSAVRKRIAMADSDEKLNFIRPAGMRVKARGSRERAGGEAPLGRVPVSDPPSRRQNTLEQPLDTESMPESVRRRYTQDGRQYYFPSGDQAFVDKGSRLTTRSENTTVVRDLVAVAAARGWTEIKIGGTLAFRREAWREAKVAGLHVIGYKPSRAEQALLIDKLARGESSLAEKTAPESQGGAPKPRTPRPVRRTDPDLIVGKLIKHGAAPYKHDSNNDKSYFVLLKTPRGQREVWGVDLERALRHSLTDVQPGDDIGLRSISRKDFIKKTHIVNEQGERVAAEVPAHLNGWIVEQRRFFNDRAELARLFRDTSLRPSEVTRKHPELKGSYLSLQEAKLRIEKATKNPEDRSKFIAKVREEMAAAMHRGEPLTPVRMREQVRTPDIPLPEPALSR